ncbi:hypothetical protein K435DRAFT_231380 [Dendrothele bispora CBS 962.96]|uniref:NACHT domain-containing protein n=1 Tax=Dendrothele bispora (strain CBS 962.96) TaxID=1314807 RepID=A0A4S8LQN7_DENBC|nr:hypothetical protein K435DRAFT_231380 [Dendrothele bispora CBS 962.96]
MALPKGKIQRDDSKTHFEVRVLSASDLSFESIIRKEPSARVQICVGQLSPKYIIPGRKGILFTEVSASSLVRFMVIDEGLIHIPDYLRKRKAKSEESEDVLGSAERSVSDLLNKKEQITLDLSPQGQIIIQVDEKTAGTSLEDVGLGRSSDLADPTNPFDSIDDIKPFSNLSDSLDTIISALEQLLNIAQLAAAHPYVGTIVQTLSFLSTPIKAELAREKSIMVLVGQMRRLYVFVASLDGGCSVNDELKNVIDAILKQTVECALFIKEYAKKCLLTRFTKHILLEADSDKIKDFLEVFSILGRSLDRGLLVQLAYVSLRLDKRLDGINDDIKKQEEREEISRYLAPICHDGWESRPRCLDGTCLQTIESVVKWVSDTSSSTLLWLHGLAGTGKSTIATTIADYYTQLNRLGAFIYFNRKEEEKSRFEGVIRTLAYSLSMFDRRIRQKVLEAIVANRNVSKMQPEVQFSNLISHPLNSIEALATEGPIVIVIDALDECSGGDDARQSFFHVLVGSSAHLPKTVRIIVTSRFSPKFQAPCPDMYHILPYKLERSHEDVEFYIRYSLARRKKPNWPKEEDLQALVRLADGLFIWAAIALRYILGEKKETLFPERRLRTLITKPAVIRDLNELYATALRAADEWDEEDRQSICAVLGVIMFVKTPLLPDTVDRLLQLNDSDYASRVVEGLESVLDYSPGHPITIPHATFSDYLSSCPDQPWYIDSAAHKRALAKSCLLILDRSLRKLDVRSSTTLEEATAYSCRFWVTHFLAMDPYPSFEHDLLDFLKLHLLHWLEAMSMLRASHTCAGLLERLFSWVKTHFPSSTMSDPKLHQLIHDGIRFTTFFSDTITDQPRSIYTCALSFVPTQSQMYMTFHDTAYHPTVLGGYQSQWSKSLRVLRQLGQSVQCLAVSPNGGKLLATGQPKGKPLENTGIQLRLWDMSTGLEAIPAVALDDFSVAVFSLDGSKVWCASRAGTIKEIDATTGEVISVLTHTEWSFRKVGDQIPKQKETVGNSSFSRLVTSLLLNQNRNSQIRSPNSGNDDPLTKSSVSKWVLVKEKLPEIAGTQLMFDRITFSSNRQIVVFGHNDGKLCLVDLIKRRQSIPDCCGPPLPVFDLDITRLLRSIAFDDSDSCFAIASRQGKIEIRDTRSGLVHTTLKGHERSVTALKFVSGRLVSSAVDGTIRMWNPTTAELIHTVETGMSDYEPLWMDPSGKSIVSTTKNGTMYIWDVQSGRKLGILQGPCNAISAIAFSGDGTRMITGAFLSDIQIWDFSSFDKNAEIQRHDRPVHNVEMSPDGFCVRSWRDYNDPDDDMNDLASAGIGRDVKFWDVVTGKELKTQPYDRSDRFNGDGSSVMVNNLEGRKDEEDMKVENNQFGGPEEWPKLTMHGDSLSADSASMFQLAQSWESDDSVPSVGNPRVKFREGNMKQNEQEKDDENKESTAQKVEFEEIWIRSTRTTPVWWTKVNRKIEGEVSVTRRVPLFFSDHSGLKRWKRPLGEQRWEEIIQLSNTRAKIIIEDASNAANDSFFKISKDFNDETREIWRMPQELGRCNAANDSFFKISKDFNGETREIWRMPPELGRCRSVAARGNICTFGMWDGRVFSMYFPDEMLGSDDAKVILHRYSPGSSSTGLR